ncbi:pseudouridine synthase [Oceanospirillum sanctuarii]|uniref:pseudouridine synthase n=1 Tax=Oceanospirillum sanctuarii TaxID=1434821 RepID=UPI000A3A9FE5|nr:pseudouridine synthase [Oceanospirillum sanctuarii]
MSRLILFNKPFQVLSQFTDSEGRSTLADYITESGIYPAGRLDYDSEGLLLLTDDGQLQHRIASPDMKLPKTYVIQVEGDVTEEALQQLRKGVELKDGMTRPAKARKIGDPGFAERNPPVRKRQSIPTSWVELVISEGRNRQVRRMSAAVGFPTLRLVRTRIGNWTLEGISEGESAEIEVNLPVVPKNTSSRAKAKSTAPGNRSKRPIGKSPPNSNKDGKSNRGGKTGNRPHSKGHSRTGQKSPTGKAKR